MAARSRRSMSCCRTATAPARSAAIPCSGSSMAPTAGRTPGFRASPPWPPASRESWSCRTADSSACTWTGGTAACVALPPGPPTISRSCGRRSTAATRSVAVAAGTQSPASRWVVRERCATPGCCPATLAPSPASPPPSPTCNPISHRAAWICLPVPNLGGRTVYETIFGSADGAFAEGNSPQALAVNYEHTRIYLTSGDGVNCPEDPVTPGIALDGVTESLISLLQGPYADAVRVAGADVTAVTTCGRPHLRRLGPRVRRRS